MNNADRTSTPISTDSAVVALIRKRIHKSEGAFAEFEKAGRSDLRENEAAQISVLQDYITGSNILTGDALSKIVRDTMDKMKQDGLKLDKGTVMKTLIQRGGVLEGQLVENKEVAALVSKLL